MGNEGTDGYVIADAVQFLPVSDGRTPARPDTAERP